MAQFKSFASKGSFGDFQLEVPDTSQKILQQAEQQIRGMERAQAQVEINQELFMQDRKAARQIQEDTRKVNYDIKSRERKLYQESLDLEFKQEQEKDRRIASAQQQVYKDLSEFSKTAFGLYGQIEAQYKKADSTRKNAVAVKAGLDYNDLQAITKINEKLTRSQFDQLDFIQQKIKEGASPEQINALYEVHRSSGSRAWYQTKAVYLNSMSGYESFLQQGLKDLPDNASYAQIDAAIEGLQARFLEQNFAGARTEVLESSGVFKGIRQYNNSIRNGFYRQAAKENEARIETEYRQSLTGIYASPGGGVAALQRELAQNSSADKRRLFFDWMIQSSKGNGQFAVKAEDIEQFLSNKYIFNGKETTIREQFNGFEELGKLEARLKQMRDEEATKLRRDENQFEADLENRMALRTNQLIEDGYLSREELQEIEAMADNAPAGFANRSNVLKEIRTLTDDVRLSKLQSDQWQARLDQGFPPPSMQQIADSYMTPTDKARWRQIAGTYSNHAKDLKEQRDLISTALRSHEIYKETPGNKYNYALKEQELFRKFNARVAARGYEFASEIRATVVAELQEEMSNPGTFDKQGRFISIVNREAEIVKEDKAQGRDFLFLIQSIRDIPETRRDYKELISHYGAANYYADLDKLRAGQKASSKFYYVADALGLMPMELAEAFAKAGGEKPISDVKLKLPPLTRRLYVHYPSRERHDRGQALSGLTGNLPTRQSFDVSFTPAQNAFIQTVAWAEGTSGPDGYNKVYGGAVVPQLTQMTLGELYEATKLGGTDRLPARLGGGIIPFKKDRYNSSASGKLQLMPETLRGLVENGNFSWNDTFSPSTQNKMILILAANGGVDVENMNEAQMTKAGGIWAGLTPQYGQTTRTASQSLNRFNALRNQ